MSEPTTRVAPWEDFVLRLIAIYKLFHGVFFTAVGVGLLRLRHHDLVEFLHTNIIIPYHIPPENEFVDWLLEGASQINPHMLVLLGWGAFFYAALFFAEGIGLYLRKVWAEYLVVVVSGWLLPFEIYKLWYGWNWWVLAFFIGNVAIVGYLIHRLLLEHRNRRMKAELSQAQPKDGPAARAPSAETRKVISEV